jgi:uncharacterized protein YndB with AHSA1/START domain
MTDERKTREQTHEIEIGAPADTVWWALTTPEGIRSWFVTIAEVEPGEGGKLRLVWEEMGGMEGTAAIDAWEPGRRLLLRRGGEGEGPVILEEWTIESLAGGKCRLRLVQSGIPDDGSWDGFYDSTDRGWRLYLDLMAHALGRHGRPERRVVTVFENVAGDGGDAWDRIVGEAGLAIDGELRTGGTVRVRTPEAELAAEVVDVVPGEILVLRVPERGDRAIAFLIHPSEKQSMYWAQISGYGEDAPDAEALEPWLRSIAPRSS